MRKIKLILIASIAFYNVAHGQKTIELDFSSKANTTLSVNDIEQGDFFQIRINGINQNLFKVSLTTIDTILSIPQLTPTFGNFDLDALSKVISGISPLSTTLNESLQKLTKSLSSLEENVLLPASVLLANAKIVERMEREEDTLSMAKQTLEQIAVEIDDLKLGIYKLRLNSYKIDNPKSTFNFDQALKDLEKMRKDIFDLKAKITSKKNSYETFSNNNKTQISKDADLASNDKLIKDSYQKFLIAITEGQASISADKANEFLSYIIFIENNANNTYTSLPIQFMGEQSKVKISITPRDEKYNLQSYSTQITFPQLNTYNVVGISFYGSTLHDKAYSTVKTKINDSTFNFNFQEENVSKAELGVAAILRHGKKWNDENNLGVHFSIGAGVSISKNIKPRVLFGGGLSFGKKHMIAADLGGMVGYVDRLSSSIDISKTYLEKPENITVSKIGMGIFLSLGYTYQF